MTLLRSVQIPPHVLFCSPTFETANFILLLFTLSLSTHLLVDSILG